jgi:hypothetical protein
VTTDSAAATVEELPPTLRDRICLVTGATSGIGRVAATALAGMGAKVLMAGRDRGRGEAAVEEISASRRDRGVSPGGFLVVADGARAGRGGALPALEHRAGILDPTRARLGLLRKSDPLDLISRRDGRDVRPQRPCNEPEISACARGEFEACLEEERI